MNLAITNTFAKTTTLIYSIGTLGHITVNIFRPPLVQISIEEYDIILLLGGYTSFGVP